MKARCFEDFCIVALALGAASSTLPAQRSAAPFSEMNLAGELTQTTAILQSRLGAGETLVNDDIPGLPGWGYFEISADSAFADPVRTDWLQASPANDFMLKVKIEQLHPNTRYVYRVRAGANRSRAEAGHTSTFREQVPVVDPAHPAAKTYRTYRVNRLLQIWLLEGRDYRSPNDMPDGPHKTLWGAEQKEWLKSTLKESDAVFKIIISPTPLVGPDHATKRDNHTNPNGFLHEGTEFIAWLAESRLLSPNVFVMNGDRHWQYHSIHPAGLEEFSSGSLIKQNSRFGREPGDPNSTDPEGRIQQPYIRTVPIGGFLHVSGG